MKNSDLDRRVKYTRNVVRHSFLELLTNKPIGKITVKEICEKADINRTTFYAHYESVYDLLDKIEEEFYQEVLGPVNKMEQEDYTGILPALILQKIQKNEKLCKAMFGKYGDKEFLAKMMYFARDNSLNAWKKLHPETETEKLEWLYEFIVNGSAGVIQYWVQSGFKTKPEETAGFMAQMFKSCIRTLENPQCSENSKHKGR